MGFDPEKLLKNDFYIKKVTLNEAKIKLRDSVKFTITITSKKALSKIKAKYFANLGNHLSEPS